MARVILTSLTCDAWQYALKKPDAILFSRKNHIVPFDDATSLEFFSTKNDWCAILMGSGWVRVLAGAHRAVA